MSSVQQTLPVEFVGGGLMDGVRDVLPAAQLVLPVYAYAPEQGNGTPSGRRAAHPSGVICHVYVAEFKLVDGNHLTPVNEPVLLYYQGRY